MSADIVWKESYKVQAKLRVEVPAFFGNFACRLSRDYHKLYDDLKQVDSGSEAEKRFFVRPGCSVERFPERVSVLCQQGDGRS